MQLVIILKTFRQVGELMNIFAFTAITTLLLDFTCG